MVTSCHSRLRPAGVVSVDDGVQSRALAQRMFKGIIEEAEPHMVWSDLISIGVSVVMITGALTFLVVQSMHRLGLLALHIPGTFSDAQVHASPCILHL